MITGVAIMTATALYSVDRPARHADLFNLTSKQSPEVHGGVQGFVDENDVLYNRTEAAEHALACGQIEKLISPPELFSEDLW